MQFLSADLATVAASAPNAASAPTADISKLVTLGDLKRSGYKVIPVKEELRRNLIHKLEKHEPLFPNILGYEETVIPQMINALLARHDIILLGLRGQAKTRIARMLTSLLDEYIPVVAGSEINDDPFSPISHFAVQAVKNQGDATPILWVHRSERYGEKLATPDVTIADLIGDIDPLKAAHQRLHYSHEGAIHFGIIPRSNRGIFTINELPDLQPRIQVGLFNILEERDIQIRGFNIRIPLDVMMIFTANPEDYTNRGSIITPLKDRIASQILTHYPREAATAIAITEQESAVDREGRDVRIPQYFREIIEQIAFEARRSDFIDQKSGVSARLSISAMENLISNAERRAILTGEPVIVPRVTDVQYLVPSITGKVELVFEGEQEGMETVAKALIGKAVKHTFRRYFPNPIQNRANRSKASRYAAELQRQESGSQPNERSEYEPILSWFSAGNNVTLTDIMPFDAYLAELSRVPGLRALVVSNMSVNPDDPQSLASAMEFVLDGLHQHSKIAREETAVSGKSGSGRIRYQDMVGSIFSASYFTEEGDEEDDADDEEDE